MVRASLPIRGVAVVLLCASAAAGQVPLPTADFSTPFLSPAPPGMLWQFPSETPAFYETEMPPLLDVAAETSLASFDAPAPASAPKDSSPRLTPTPNPSAQSTNQPPAQSDPVIVDDGACPGAAAGGACPGGACPGGLSDGAFPCAPTDGAFPCAPSDGACPCAPTLLPFACPCPPPPPPPCCRKCCRKHRHGCCGGPGYGWPCGMQCCPNFCAPPPPPPCCHKCCRKHRCHQGCGGYPGYGYGGCGYGFGGGFDGGLCCDGCMGMACPAFFCNPCPPPPPPCCRKCCRKHGCHQSCGGYGYDGGYGFGGYDGGYGWGGCGYGGYGYGGCCGHHHGRRHCHSCKHMPPPYPPPCFACPMMPCMDMGFCSDCDGGFMY